MPTKYLFLLNLDIEENDIIPGMAAGNLICLGTRSLEYFPQIKGIDFPNIEICGRVALEYLRWWIRTLKPEQKNKITAILQTTFSDAFSWMAMNFA